MVVSEGAEAVSEEPDQYTRKSPEIVTSRPEHILRHDISDEELDLLCESRSDFVLEALLLAVGGFIGTVPTAISVMVIYFMGLNAAPSEASMGAVDSFSTTDIAQVILFWACLSVALVVGMIFKSRRERSLDLRASIRARKNK